MKKFVDWLRLVATIASVAGMVVLGLLLWLKAIDVITFLFGMVIAIEGCHIVIHFASQPPQGQGGEDNGDDNTGESAPDTSGHRGDSDIS